MRQIQNTLRFRFEMRLTERQISGALGVVRSTVHEFLDRTDAPQLTWPLPYRRPDQDLGGRAPAG